MHISHSWGVQGVMSAVTGFDPHSGQGNRAARGIRYFVSDQ